MRIILTLFFEYFLTFLAQTWRLKAGRVFVSESATVWMRWAPSYRYSYGSSLIYLMPYFMCSNLKDAITALRSSVISVKKVSLRRVFYIFSVACAVYSFLFSTVSHFFFSSFTHRWALTVLHYPRNVLICHYTLLR